MGWNPWCVAPIVMSRQRDSGCAIQQSWLLIWLVVVGRAFPNARIFPPFVSNAIKTFYLGRPNKKKRELQIALWWHNTLITYKMRPLKVCQKIFGNVPYPLSMNLTHYFEVMTTSSRCGRSVEGLSKCIFYYAISIIYESNASFRSYGNVVTRRPPWPVRAEQCCQSKGSW